MSHSGGLYPLCVSESQKILCKCVSLVGVDHRVHQFWCVCGVTRSIMEIHVCIGGLDIQICVDCVTFLND